MIHYLVLILTIVFLSACSSSSSKSTNISQNNTGYLIDSAVSGVEYYCNNISGITDNNGSFSFNNSCNDIVFKIGSITLASMKVSNVNPDHKFYMTDITQRSIRSDTNNTAVKNISRLLQTLDEDSNPENGIHITSNIRENIKNNLSFEVISSNVNEQDLKNIILDAGLDKELVTALKALVHVEQTLRSNNIYVDTVQPYPPFLSNNIFATDNDITVIDINGEKNTKIYLNGIDTNQTINENGIYKNFEIDTSNSKNTFRDFNISLRDSTNKESDIYNLEIFKDTDDLDNKSAFNLLNSLIIVSPNTFVYDINITDNSTDYNLSIEYEITGNNKDLFDINSTTGILSFKDPSIATNIYTINVSVSDLANHTISKDITITVN
jgi:hypothetical protein